MQVSTDIIVYIVSHFVDSNNILSVFSVTKQTKCLFFVAIKSHNSSAVCSMLDKSSLLANEFVRPPLCYISGNVLATIISANVARSLASVCGVVFRG